MSTYKEKSAITNTRVGVIVAVAIFLFACVSTCIAQTGKGTVSLGSTQTSGMSLPEGVGRVTSGGETLHVLVGHSLFFNTRLRLHKVIIADPTVLNSVTLSANQIVVTAMTSGICSLVLLDEAGHAQSYIVSSDVDVAGLRVAMSDAMRNDAVKVEGSGDRVILSGKVGSEALEQTAVKLAGIYSKDVANAMTISPEHAKQVRLKVRILEVDRSKAQQYGINLFNPGGNTSFLASATTGQYASTATYGTSSSGNGTVTVSDPLNFLLYSSKLNFGATVRDLESKQVLQILAEPTITTVSGQKADFLSGGEFPFPMVQPGGTGSSPVVTISFRPYGVKLEFTPIVNDDGTIRLKVAPEVSALDYTNSVSISGYTVPALSVRKAETEVELRSNQSFAISGLLDQRTTDILQKNPGVASIPILGALFKSKNYNHATTELVVVVTPTLVDPLTETSDPVQPDLPLRRLNPEEFDKSLNKSLSPQSKAPQINPDMSFNPSSTASSSSPSLNDSTKIVTTKVTDGASQAGRALLSNTQTATVSVNPTNTTIVSPSPSDYGHYIPYHPEDSTGHSGASASDISKPETSRSSLTEALPEGEQSSKTTNSAAHFMIQVMALSNGEYAETMVAALRRQGYAVAVTHDLQDSLFHLQIGPFENMKDAEIIRKRLLHDGYNAIIK